jgi:glucose-1-phosphate cytidylyltransferase
MKVVLFCGGLGMRLREYSEIIPKPMVTIGYRPILWNVMKYYAHHGHKDFILCLGYKADMIKNYFLNYNEYLSNDFTLTEGGRKLELKNSDIGDWKITFVDTGLTSNIGQRLMAVRHHLEGEDVFLANYSDNLTDFPLSKLIDFFNQQKKIAAFLCSRPNVSFHLVSSSEDGMVSNIQDVIKSGFWINGGCFVFRKNIFDYIKKGEELVQEPFQRLINEKQLCTIKYDGFFVSMDTFKEKQLLDDMYSRGQTPWEVWKWNPENGPR